MNMLALLHAFYTEKDCRLHFHRRLKLRYQKTLLNCFLRSLWDKYWSRSFARSFCPPLCRPALKAHNFSQKTPHLQVGQSGHVLISKKR